jgi:hypothetical protein
MKRSSFLVEEVRERAKGCLGRRSEQEGCWDACQVRRVLSTSVVCLFPLTLTDFRDRDPLHVRVQQRLLSLGERDGALLGPKGARLKVPAGAE